MKSVLIIGAGGFIGGFIAQRALQAGYNTFVGVRKSTSRKYLSDERLNFVVLDYDDSAQVEQTLTAAAPSPKGWDYIIWNLGATKCANFQDFNKINYRYIADFVAVLKKIGMVPEKFLYMSSLSALGMGDEKTYAPLTSQTLPKPNTRYGLSKIKAEMHLEMQSDVPWIIFRPTGVYGPHEKDYLMMIQSIDRHCDVSMGFKKQMLTFIYVEDLVEAMFQCLAADSAKVVHKKYIISEDRAYTQKEFRKIVAHHLGTKFVVPICLPMWMVYVVSVICEKVAAAQMKASTLNRDKFKIMKQRNWNCDITDAKRDFGFNPQWSLDRGIAATVAAYKELKTNKSL
jgi:nucleoside-diphosphate-sugar epimerase